MHHYCHILLSKSLFPQAPRWVCLYFLLLQSLNLQVLKMEVIILLLLAENHVVYLKGIQHLSSNSVLHRVLASFWL